MALIEVKQVSKIYSDNSIPVHALDEISLKIEKEEFTAIVGPSGSGKTTLLNMIGGLDKPTNGTIIINETDISTFKTDQMINFRLRNIGFVFQAYNLIPVFTARENVEFIMLLQKISKEEREQKAIELLKAVDLEDKIDKKPTELSGGQQQRVAVARALASKPSFVLADEPTANLDSVTANNLLDLMEKLNEENKMTFVFSTHDSRVIERAHRVVTLRDGCIESDKIRNELATQQK
jgi:putative ABC transport system ATP-binding protein